MRPPIYDWHTIEQEFIHDNVPLHNGITLKTVAVKHGIPYQTVRRKAAADKWHSNRYWCYLSKTDPDIMRYHENLDKQLERIKSRNSKGET